MSYIKLRCDFFEHDEIVLLEKMKNGFVYVNFYLRLLCNSERFKHGYRIKKIKLAHKVGYSNAGFLALMFRSTSEKVEECIAALQKISLVSLQDNSIIIRDINIDPYRNRECKEYSEWRNFVFKRDNYTCQHCRKIGVKLNAHHIKPWALYPKLRFNVDNGITLCEDCHKKLHKRLRRTNNG